MNGNVAWTLDMQVREGRGEEFRAVMAEMAAATEANEPGTLAYEWYTNEAGTVCHLYERYRDSAAAIIHIRTFEAKYASRFLAVLRPVGVVLYGSPAAEVKAALAGFKPLHLELAAGFSR